MKLALMPAWAHGGTGILSIFGERDRRPVCPCAADYVSETVAILSLALGWRWFPPPPRHAFGPCGQVANENKIFNHILDPVGPAYTTVDDEKLVLNSRSKKQLHACSLDPDQVDMKGERIPRSRLLQSCKNFLKVKDFERNAYPGPVSTTLILQS